MTGLLAHRAIRIVLGFVAPALLLVWWQWQARAHITTFAPPSAIGVALAEVIADGSLRDGVIATLRRAFTGLAIGAPLGIAIGMATAVWRPLDRILSPLLNALRQVPMIGWLPLMGLWFGAGESSQLIVIAMSSFFPSMLNSHAGVAQIEGRYLDVGRVYGLTTAQRFRLILLPAAMPMILTGLTQALAFAWIATIGTELLTGADAGLGVVMQLAQTQQRLDIMLVVLAATAILGFSINRAFLHLRRFLLRWQPSVL